MLVNYAARRARGLPISSAGAESAVDYVVGQRMKRNGHMRWTRHGANALLQVRCAVLKGLDVRNFKRWHPPDKQFAPLPPPPQLQLQQDFFAVWKDADPDVPVLREVKAEYAKLQ